MYDYQKLTELAAVNGFSYSAPLDVSKLEFLQEIRDMCNPGQCNSYGKSWSCPPACPSLEEMRERVKSYSGGLLVQTVGDLEDSYDWEGIMEAGKRHKQNFGKLRETLEKEHPSLLAMGAGACMLCEKCTYPDEPCRFPDKLSASMEACGLYVSKVCTDNNLKYNYGPDKIAFSSCFLLKD
jgi:predicted metal-binding protein